MATTGHCNSCDRDVTFSDGRTCDNCGRHEGPLASEVLDLSGALAWAQEAADVDRFEAGMKAAIKRAKDILAARRAELERTKPAALAAFQAEERRCKQGRTLPYVERGFTVALRRSSARLVVDDPTGALWVWCASNPGFTKWHCSADFTEEGFEMFKAVFPDMAVYCKRSPLMDRLKRHWQNTGEQVPGTKVVPSCDSVSVDAGLIGAGEKEESREDE